MSIHYRYTARYCYPGFKPEVYTEELSWENTRLLDEQEARQVAEERIERAENYPLTPPKLIGVRVERVTEEPFHFAEGENSGSRRTGCGS